MTIQSAISADESVKIVLVLQNKTTFSSDGGIDRFMTHSSTFSAWSKPMPEFNGW